MSKRIYYLSSAAPTANITCAVKMKSASYDTSNGKLKRSGGTNIAIARTGDNGEALGSGDINNTLVGAAQAIQGAKLIFSHSLDLGYCTDEDWMQILKASTKDEYQEKYDAFVKFVQDGKWKDVFDILNLSILYTLDGGIHGAEEFGYDLDDVFDHSDDGLVIILAKAIELTYT